MGTLRPTPARGKKINKNGSSKKDQMISSVANTSKFLSNMMDPDHPFMIPRLVPTEATMNRYQTSKAITIDEESRYLVGMVQPSIEAPIVILKKSAEGIDYTGRRPYESYHHLASTGQVIDWDNELQVEGGSSRLAPTHIDNGLHYAEYQEKVVSGGKAFNGIVNTHAANAWWFNVKNNNSTSVTMRAGLYVVNEGVRQDTGIWGTSVTIAAGASQKVYCGEFTQSGTPDSFTLSFRIDAVGSSQAQYSLDVGVGGALSLGATWIWERMPFMSSTGEHATVLANYAASSGVSTTGFSFLLQNHAASIQKGGTICAAKMAGGSRKDMPMDPVSIASYVSTRNGRDVVSSSPLKDGLFWSYSPEKLQDLMFRKHPDLGQEFLYGDRQLPYILFACKWSSPEMAPDLVATFKINMEYITNNVVVPKWISPVDTGRLMELWIALSSNHCHLTENPKHLKAIKDWTFDVIGRTLKNPDFQAAAKGFGKAAGTAALMALI